MFYRILEVKPKENLAVWIRFSDGLEGDISMKSVAERGGVFRRLTDEQYFRSVTIGENGRYLEWPDQLDFCADALHEKLRNAEDAAAV